jgi:4-hydroxy-tetrahydrodipicolinate reductase
MSGTPVRIAIFGATGRMGSTFAAQVLGDSGTHLTGATTSPEGGKAGQDVGEYLGGSPLGVALTTDPLKAVRDADVAVDVALPAAFTSQLEACVRAGVPLLIGATGHDETIRREIDKASKHIAVLIAPNMSLGVNVLLALSEQAARALGAQYDAEIFEAHHRYKRDAPSGTALAIGESVARGRNVSLDATAVFERHGTVGPRASGTIGFSVQRAGDIVGEHVLTLAGPGERLEIAHRASDRTAFARGGLRAACWLAGREPGRYSMRDVMGL